MYKRVFYGQITNEAIQKLRDVRGPDLLVFILLGFFIVLIGVYPIWLLNVFHASVGHIMQLALGTRI